jgi:hypothetical protein
LTAIARREGVDLSHLVRTLRLAYLAPDIVRDVLSGAADQLNVERLIRSDFPLEWSAQRRVFSLSR